MLYRTLKILQIPQKGGGILEYLHLAFKKPLKEKKKKKEDSTVHKMT